MSKVTKAMLLVGIALVIIGATFAFVPAINQWPQYHEFADQRAWLGIPNALDVLSSLPFVAIGWLGLRAAGRLTRPAGDGALRWLYRCLFFGVLLTGLGSIVYHIAPTTTTLFWDRLPMSIAFMALLATIIAEMIDVRWAVRMLPVLLLLGVGGVIQWAWSEASGAGDLRWYGLVQFLPVLLVALITLLYPAPARYLRHLAGLVGLYAISKLFEHYDAAVFDALGGAISGHTLKHLAAAVGLLFVLSWVRRRARDSV